MTDTDRLATPMPLPHAEHVQPGRVEIHLVRHGQTDWNATRRIQGQLDIPLNDAGREQARELGQQLCHVTFDAVFCSTSARARETTELMVQQRDIRVDYRNELRDICLGDWEGRYWADIEQLHPERARQFFRSLPEFRVAGGETHAELQARGVQAISRITSEVGHGQVLVVSHGGLMKRLLSAYTGTDLTNRTDLPALPNCAHCIVEAVDGHYQVLSVAGQPLCDTRWADPGRQHH